MKFMHTGDLHLGKRVNEFSMLEDQAYILQQILRHVKAENPDLFLIAGDVYDRAVPPADAVQLFDQFLTELSKGTKVALVPGNHDSPERLAFGTELMREKGVYLAPCYGGHLLHFPVTDSLGTVEVTLLPFLRPAAVRPFAGEDKIADYTEAVQFVLEKEKLDFTGRRLLVAHQFVTGAVPSESEELSVGGLDNVDAAVFAGFDYVALGHIHRAQQVTRPGIRYAGTPLKYSFAESLHEKSITVGTLLEKGSCETKTIPLHPLRDLRKCKGPFLALSDPLQCPKTQDYVHITLTDEEEIVDAVGKLRVLYPNLMRLEYDNKRSRALALTLDAVQIENPAALFAAFYEGQNGQPLGIAQREYITGLVGEFWEQAPNAGREEL